MDKPEDLRPEVDSWYLTHYLDALGQLRSHQFGHVDTPLPPSFIPPTGCWTSQEKDTFFHGLSVYSRLRPDLIADCIKTKSVVDVCNYLDVLEEAASFPENKETHVHRKAIPAAMEMSKKWIEFEEDKATQILAVEGRWDEEALQTKRRNETVAQKMLLTEQRRRKREGSEIEGPNATRELAFKPWLAQQTQRWKQEDFCKALDSRDLVAVGMILREAEQTQLDKVEQATEVTSQPQHIATTSSESPVPYLPSAPQLQPVTPFDQSVIDPVLLALSRHLHQEATPVQTENGEEVGSEPEHSPSPRPDAILANLSPASRRRYQKRLYMRRKRAKLSGREVDDKVCRLKPGRKAKKVMRSKSTTADAPVDASAEGMDVDSDRDGDFRHSHASGKTLPYKILAEFTAVGIDAEILSDLGLDLFHPGGLAKLMNVYTSLYDDHSTPESRISHETIRLLRMHVVQFLTNIVHRTIVMREQEQALKSHTKVWKVSNKKVITRDNVEQALKLMGSGKSNKREYLVDLVRRFDIEGDGNGDDNGNDDGDSPIPAEQEADFADTCIPGDEDKAQLPPCRSIYPPFVRLSHTFYDESLVPDEIDGDNLLTELLEDDELDRMDQMLDQMHEKGLWERFRAASERTIKFSREDDVQEDLSNDEEPSLGRIESKAFISDSD